MALRDTQDALIVEQQWTSGTLRVTQDALLVEWQNSTAHLRVTQDALIFEYPFVNAMFVYQPLGASARVGFTPVYPPVKKQPLGLWGLEAKRADSIAADGSKESQLEQLIAVTKLSFPFVALSDMAAWKAFEQYALSGATFAYCPSYDPWMKLDPTGFSEVQLLTMDWKPKFESFQIFSLEMKLKLVRDM